MMEIEDVVFVHNWFVYKEVAFEDAELQELGDVLSDVFKSIQKACEWSYNSLKPFRDSIIKLEEQLTGTPKYKTEGFIILHTRRHYLKNKYGLRTV